MTDAPAARGLLRLAATGAARVLLTLEPHGGQRVARRNARQAVLSARGPGRAGAPLLVRAVPAPRAAPAASPLPLPVPPAPPLRRSVARPHRSDARPHGSDAVGAVRR